MKTTTVSGLAMAALLALAAPTAAAPLFTTYVGEDASVNSATPSTTYGGQDLQVGVDLTSVWRFYLKFDVSAFAGTSIRKARLTGYYDYLNDFEPTDNRTMNIYAGGDGWSAVSLNWDNQTGNRATDPKVASFVPPCDPALFAANHPCVPANGREPRPLQLLAFDVTSALKAALAGDGILTLYFAQDDETVNNAPPLNQAMEYFTASEGDRPFKVQAFVPEPASLTLVALALAGAGLRRRRA